jgi:hypothetical protein
MAAEAVARGVEAPEAKTAPAAADGVLEIVYRKISGR